MSRGGGGGGGRGGGGGQEVGSLFLTSPVYFRPPSLPEKGDSPVKYSYHAHHLPIFLTKVISFIVSPFSHIYVLTESPFSPY